MPKTTKHRSLTASTRCEICTGIYFRIVRHQGMTDIQRSHYNVNFEWFNKYVVVKE